MNILRNLKIGSKILLSFIILIALMIIIGVTGYKSMSEIESRLKDIFSVRLPAIDFIIEADRDLQQLLVAERSMIFSAVSSDFFKKLLDSYYENMEQSEERFENYKKLAQTQEEKDIILKYEKAKKEWQHLSKQVIEGRLEDTRDGRRLAIDLTLGEASVKFEIMRNYLDQLTELNLKLADIAQKKAYYKYVTTSFLFFTIILFGIFLGIILTLIITKNTTKPITGLVKVANDIADGDLGIKRMHVKSRDELGILMSSFNKMLYSLNDTLKQVNSAATQVSAGSNQVAQASQSLSQGATEQAGSLEEITSAITEISNQIKLNSENASQASGLSKQAMENAENGNRQMQELVIAMNEINKSSDEVKRIVKVIDDIAFQTNLLALNANVEAARAGKYGKGFAVVAEEVRNLASRSAESVQETTTMVEQSMKNIENGNILVKTTSKQLEEILNSASKVSDLVGEIAIASKEQTHGLEQINQGLDQIDQITQSNTASAEETASASEELASQAQQLKSVVAKFKLKSEDTLEIPEIKGLLKNGH